MSSANSQPQGQSEQVAKTGDTVRVHYTGRLDDGNVFDSSEQREPLELTLGEARVIPGFQQAVVGMAPGTTKTAEIPSSKAYGDRQEEMVVNFDRQQIPPTIAPEPGQQVQLQTEQGEPIAATIVKVTDESVTVDANHPLAGQDLTFDIRLVEIVESA
jgi:peptidylprolyl isomerase